MRFKSLLRTLLSVVVLIVLFLTTGCVVDRDKKELKELYTDNSNYITITGEIVSVSQSYKQTFTNDNWVIFVEIEYPISDDKENKERYEYRVFAQKELELSVGDIITYTTVAKNHKRYHFPIVEIVKNGNAMLEFEDGKENLLRWVDALAYK